MPDPGTKRRRCSLFRSAPTLVFHSPTLASKHTVTLTSHDEDNGSDGSGDSPVPGGVDGIAGELHLETDASRPDEDVEEKDDATADESARPAPEGGAVEHETNEDGADDGAETSKEGDEGAGTAVEQEGDDGSLVGVDWNVSAKSGVCVLMTSPASQRPAGTGARPRAWM
jgi:hypothetical protein